MYCDIEIEDTSDYFLTRMLVPRFTPRLLRELNERIKVIEVWDKPHILTGIVGQPFSLGGDLGYFLECIDSGTEPFEDLYSYAMFCAKLVVEHYNIPQLTVSYLQGDAFGGGLEVALASDVRLALPSANLGFPEARFGSFPGMGGFRLLSNLLPPSVAMDAILTGSLLQDGHKLVSIVDSEEQAIRKLKYYARGRVAQLKLFKKANPLTFEDMEDSVNAWTHTMMKLTDSQVDMIRRIYKVQQRGITDV